jgi:hypothetical protein
VQNAEVIEEVIAANRELENNFISVDVDKINEVPFPGSWTAGQVADHILKSQKGVTGIIQGKVKETNRDAEEKVKQLRDVFMDFSTKMKSPVFVKPVDQPIDRTRVLERIRNINEKLRAIVPGMDLSLTCLDFALPGIGEMTRLEWLYFFVYHTKRHANQMKNISERLR